MNIGVDIIKSDRFNELINNDVFLTKYFTKKEINYIKSRDNNLMTIAGIYAAKEALLKSLKKGINNYSLIDIEINHDENNAPYINLYNDIKYDYKNKKFDVSISHDGNYVIATVISY